MDWSELLGGIAQQILMAILPVLAGIAAAWLAGLAKRAWAQAQQAVGENWRWALNDGAQLVVRAAQQLFVENEDKKNYAVATLQAFLDEKGIKVDLAVIEAAIEAAVLEEFHKE